MKIVTCIENNKGLMFFKKRLSKDEKIIDDIKNMNVKLSMNDYSHKMFLSYNYDNEIIVSDEFVLDTYYFNENNSLEEYEDITEIIIYKFNRDYPSDLKLKINLEDFSLESIYEFVGKSHEKITKEVYKR